jgi:hypothetical protein
MTRLHLPGAMYARTPPPATGVDDLAVRKMQLGEFGMRSNNENKEIQ